MAACKACGRTIKPWEQGCTFCGAAPRNLTPPARSSRWNEAITFSGVFLTVFILGLCVSPVLLLLIYLAFLVLPLYLTLVIGGALALAARAWRLCRVSGGRIPISAYLGYALLITVTVIVMGVKFSLLQADAQKLQDAKLQFGPLFYRGALPDPDFPPAIRTSASLTDVVRFYRENPACDAGRSYGGGGDYSIYCRPANSSGVWIKLSSRVHDNEPYILIRMEF